MSDIPDFDYYPPIPPDKLKEFEDYIAEKMRDITSVFESDLCAGNTHTSTLAAYKESVSLTMKDLQESFNKVTSALTETYERTPFYGVGVPLPFPQGALGVPIYTSRYLGDTVYPQAPAMRPGPYYKRRIRRWHRAHPAYTVGNGNYYRVDGQIWCHPDDVAPLMEAMNKFHPVESEGR